VGEKLTSELAFKLSLAPALPDGHAQVELALTVELPEREAWPWATER